MTDADVFYIGGHGLQEIEYYEDVVPEGVTIVVRAHVGEVTYSTISNDRPFCQLPFHILQDPVRYKAELVKAFGSVAIYTAGMKYPVFKYGLLAAYSNAKTKLHNKMSLFGSGLLDIKQVRADNYCKNISIAISPEKYIGDQFLLAPSYEDMVAFIASTFKHSVFPTQTYIETFFIEQKERITQNDKYRNKNMHEQFDFLIRSLTSDPQIVIDQRSLQKKVTKRPAVFYNFVCRSNYITEEILYSSNHSLSTVNSRGIRRQFKYPVENGFSFVTPSSFPEDVKKLFLEEIDYLIRNVIDTLLKEQNITPETIAMYKTDKDFMKRLHSFIPTVRKRLKEAIPIFLDAPINGEKIIDHYIDKNGSELVSKLYGRNTLTSAIRQQISEAVQQRKPAIRNANFVARGIPLPPLPPSLPPPPLEGKVHKWVTIPVGTKGWVEVPPPPKSATDLEELTRIYGMSTNSNASNSIIINNSEESIPKGRVTFTTTKLLDGSIQDIDRASGNITIKLSKGTHPIININIVDTTDIDWVPGGREIVNSIVYKRTGLISKEKKNTGFRPHLSPYSATSPLPIPVPPPPNKPTSQVLPPSPNIPTSTAPPPPPNKPRSRVPPSISSRFRSFPPLPVRQPGGRRTMKQRKRSIIKSRKRKILRTN